MTRLLPPPADMGWRLYRRKRLMPGVTLGLSRSGPSLRFGGRGAGITVGGRSGLRTTVGVPGTGLYYTAVPPAAHRTRPAGVPMSTGTGASGSGARGAGILLVAVVFIVAALATSGVALFPEAGLIAGYVWWRRRRPDSRAGRLIDSAMRVPGDQAVPLLHLAVLADPSGLRTLTAAGNWFLEHACWADAADCLGKAVAVHDDPVLSAHYAKALAYSGRLDEAIARLDQLRALPLEVESHATVVSLLAQVYLFRKDLAQAMALVSEEPLRKHELGVGLQQCLSMRAQAHYLQGQHAAAIADIDRLYAINPEYPEIGSVKADMAGGTFAVEAPAAYPDWYPRDSVAG